MLFAREQAATGTAQLGRGSTIAEIPLDGGDAVISGSKTIQVDIRE
jgi:hypothetical protein